MLRVTEIFYSLQGESKTVGLPTVFIRLTGCPLRCRYCDTSYAFSGGELMTLPDIQAKVASFSPRYVTVTGGEPLAQPASIVLMRELCQSGYHVSLETSGALSVADVDKRVMKVVDVKTPASEEMHRNHLDNFQYLLPHDQLKFVIADRNDYEWSKQMLKDFKLDSRCEVLFSPSYKVMENQQLADWIIEDNLPVRFQVQLHKVIWGDVAGK